MNKSKTTVILPAGRDLVARAAERSPQPCFDTALRRLHEADRVLAEAKDTFQVSMEKAARALAPFDVDALVEANYGSYRGKTFRVREFSIGYRAGDPACLVPAVMAWGSIVGKDPEIVQGNGSILGYLRGRAVTTCRHRRQMSLFLPQPGKMFAVMPRQWKRFGGQQNTACIVTGSFWAPLKSSSMCSQSSRAKRGICSTQAGGANFSNYA